MSVWLVVLGLVAIVGLIVIHELGHFWVAKRNGVKVQEFGIFFPPRIWKKRTKGGWIFSINAVPLGGFVRLKGESDASNEPESYGAASFGVKAKILLAGVSINIVAALILLMILAWVGMPKILDNQFTVKSDTKVIKNEVLIGSVVPGSPAAKAGLRAGDQLVSLTPSHGNKQLVNNADNLPNITKSLATQTVKIVYGRDGHQYEATATLLSARAAQTGQKGYLGVADPADFVLQRSTWSAPVVAVGFAAQFTVDNFKAIGPAIAGLFRYLAGEVTRNSASTSSGKDAASQLAGPVGIFYIIKHGSALGYQFVWFLVAIISLILGEMNVLPIPGLDGGKLAMTGVARLFKKRLSETFEAAASLFFISILLFLVIVISIINVQTLH